MNKDKQIEALAAIELLELSPSGAVAHKCSGCTVAYGGSTILAPDYDSHDALQRIIDGFGKAEYQKYYNIMKYNHSGLMLRATFAEKREAILKAKGLWV